MTEQVEWAELLRRARISLSWENNRARKKAQAKMLRNALKDPVVREKQRARLKALNERTREERIERLRKAMANPSHPFHPLPPMSKKERRRYRYMREKGGTREMALDVIMMERQERPAACAVNPFEVNDAYEPMCSKTTHTGQE